LANEACVIRQQAWLEQECLDDCLGQPDLRQVKSRMGQSMLSCAYSLGQMSLGGMQHMPLPFGKKAVQGGGLTKFYPCQWFTDVSRKVTFPERRFPERRFPDSHFPGKTFP